MKRREPVDLNDYLNQTHTEGNPADFPIHFEPVQYHNPVTNEIEAMSNRQVVVRSDTGQAISVVSNRYALVEHKTVLETIDHAIAGLDVGPIPKGVYMSAGGAVMRAIYKFPAIERTLSVHALDRKQDRLCPLVKIVNSLDGTSKVSIEVGAFSWVCSNFSIGGSGFWTGGFMAVHAGTVKVEAAGQQLRNFLKHFDDILDLLAHWSTIGASEENHRRALQGIPPRYSDRLLAKRSTMSSVFDVYNDATNYCTHQLRSAQRAIQLLAETNRGFQAIDEWMPRRVKAEVVSSEVIDIEAVPA